MCPDCVSSLSEKTETGRYSPFVIATNDALEKLQDLDIPGLKRAPEGPERIIFLANQPNEIPIQSGSAKPDVVIMRLSDAAQAYPAPLLVKEWAQLKNIAPSGVIKPRSFHKILSCIEFKATRSNLKMADCLKNGTPSLDEIDPMHIFVDGPAIRAATRAAEKESQVESQAMQVTLSGSGSKKRPRSPVDAGNESGSQPRAAKRVPAEAGPSGPRYARAVKESPMGSVSAPPKQPKGYKSQTRTPQEKTSESKTQEPILQASSYAIEMLSMTRVHTWNILIIGTCLNLGPGYLH